MLFHLGLHVSFFFFYGDNVIRVSLFKKFFFLYELVCMYQVYWT